jgi:hypothetical protein
MRKYPIWKKNSSTGGKVRRKKEKIGVNRKTATPTHLSKSGYFEKLSA